MGVRSMAVAGLLVAAACSLDVPGDVGAINIYLSVDKGTLPLGESMTITVTARNVGYDRITLAGPSDCLLYLEIRDATSLLVHQTNQHCTGATVTEALEPGLDKVQAFVWDGAGPSGARVPSGFYSIRGIARVTGNPYFGPSITVSVE